MSLFDNKVCATCRYYDKPECRERAPFPVLGAPNDRRLFPVVSINDWCGRWAFDHTADPEGGKE